MIPPNCVVAFPDIQVEPLTLRLGCLLASPLAWLWSCTFYRVYAWQQIQIWVTSLNLSIRSLTHYNHVVFTSSSNWEHRHKGMSVSTGNMKYVMYTMVNEVSLVVELEVVWYDHNISWRSSTHKPFASSTFFYSPFKITLFIDTTCPLAYGWTSYTNFVSTPNSRKKLVTIELVNWILLS